MNNPVKANLVSKFRPPVNLDLIKNHHKNILVKNLYIPIYTIVSIFKDANKMEYSFANKYVYYRKEKEVDYI